MEISIKKALKNTREYQKYKMGVKNAKNIKNCSKKLMII